ncbi:acyltransferase family protein [Actinocorallia longicatena]|uniref:Acyltransferase family protein n=1 Tax=Actinocorallia longicatena TaxID=111803 RepID=A0ABP6QG36_9ACTN
MPPVTGRESYFDNVKFVVGCLVIIGHLGHEISGPPQTYVAVEVLFASFRMPLFVFLAGHFSRGFLRGKDRAARLFTKVMAPYLLFELAYSALEAVLDGKALVWDPMVPFDHMWFLAALLLWRAAAPLWLRFRHPVALAVFVSLVSGMADLGLTVIVQTLAYLPFFVAGLVFDRRLLRWLRYPAARAVSLAGLAFLTLVFYVIVPSRFAGPGVFHEVWTNGYGPAGWSAPAGMAVRLAALATGTVVAAMVLALIPGRRSWISGLGSRSLYMYVLHYAFVMLAVRFGWYGVLPSGIPGALLLVAVAVALGAALCSRPSYMIFRWFMEPPLAWTLRYPTAPKPSQRSTF